MTDLVGLLILLLVAAVVGTLGQRLAGRTVPGGWGGAILVGLLGAWIGTALMPFGPHVQGIQVVSAVVGATLLVLALGFLGAPLGRAPRKRRRRR